MNAEAPDLDAARGTDQVAISVVIPTWKRTDDLRKTLKRLADLSAQPSELIIHIDAGDNETAAMLADEFPAVRILQSEEHVGPGGGRNKLLAAATEEFVCSLDDDSYPFEDDLFARAFQLLSAEPEIAVLACAIIHQNEQPQPDLPELQRTVHFEGCGVFYRRSAFLQTTGYVPIPLAYGMEEVDMAIRLTSLGHRLYRTPWLRVFHDTELKHHASAPITAASISNLALLAFLRYPVHYWPLGFLQVMNRILWLLTAKRLRGILKGVVMIPGHLWRHRQYRRAVSSPALREFLKLRENNEIRTFDVEELPAIANS